MHKVKLRVMLLFILIILNTPILVCYANSAQSPSIIFVVNNPPKDLSLELDGATADISNEFGESYFAFYDWSYNENEKHFLVASWDDKQITVELPPLSGYQTIYTLDLNNETITEGKMPLYTLLRGTIRLLITLVIEGIIFWLWNFRKKSSWICFFVINIITQFLLGYYLNSTTPFDGYMAVFELGFIEAFIFALEILTFCIFLKENSTGSRVCYAFFANFVSLLVGSVILSLLIA